MPDNIKLSVSEFAAKIKSKYPEYNSLEDSDLAKRIIAKYPEYADKVNMGDNKPVTPAVAPTVNAEQPVKKGVSALAVEKQYLDLYTKQSAAGQDYKSAVNAANIMEQGAYPADMLPKAKAQKDSADAEFNQFVKRIDNSKFLNDIYNTAQSKVSELTNTGKNTDQKFIDVSKLRDIVREKKVATPGSSYEDLLVNTLKGKLEHNNFLQPEIDKVANAKLASKGLTVDPKALQSKAKSDIMAFADTKSKELQQKYQPILGSTVAQIDSLNSTYKTAAENLQKNFSNPQYIQQNYAGMTQEQIKQEYDNAAKQTFVEYTKQHALLKAKYNNTSGKMMKAYEDAVNSYQSKIQKDVTGKGAEIYNALKESVVEVQKKREEDAYNKVGGYAKEGRGVFTSSFASGLANWLSSVATGISSNVEMPFNAGITPMTYLADNMRDYAKYMETPDAKLEQFSDLFDPKKFALSAGKMIGQMAPDMAIAIGTRGKLGGETTMAKLASGTLSWFGEATQSAYSNYNTMLDQGVDPLTAKDRAVKTYKGYLATLPFAIVGMEAMLGKFGKTTLAGQKVIGKKAIEKSSMLGRYLLNTGIEVGSETIEESLQNPVDAAVLEGRDPSIKDYEEAFSKGQLKQTFLSVAPSSMLMGVPGSISESISKGEGLLPSWVETQMLDSYIHNLAKQVNASGVNLTQAALESLRHNGVISEETLDQVKGKVIEIAGHIQVAKDRGLNKRQQTEYAGLMSNVQINKERLEEVDKNNPEAVKIAQNRVDAATKVAEDFLKTKNGNYAIITDKNGDTYLVTHDDLNDMLDDDSFRFDVKNKDVTIEIKANKNQPASLALANAKLTLLNRNFDAPSRRYKNQDGLILGVYRALGAIVPVTPTVVTSVDQLIGQPVEYVYNNQVLKGTLKQEGQRIVFENEDRIIDNFGTIDELRGMKPEEAGLRYVQKTPVPGKKVSMSDAKVESVAARYGGKVNPQTLIDIIMNSVEGADRNIVSSLVYTYDNAFHQDQNQRLVKDAQTEPGFPQKKLDVIVPEVGEEVDGQDVAANIAQAGDKAGNVGVAAKSLMVDDNVYTTEEIDLDEMYDDNEEFRNRVEESRGMDTKPFQSKYNNPQDMPAVIHGDVVVDGMGRLAQKYLNGEKTAVVYQYLKEKDDATKISQQQERSKSGNFGQYQGTESEQAPQTDEADNRDSNLSSEKKKTLNKINSIVKTLKNSFNIEVFTHRNAEEMKQGVAKELGDTAAMFVTPNDAARVFFDRNGNPIAIHFNLENSNAETAAHEAWHVILSKAFGNDVKLFESFKSQIDKALRSEGFEDLANELAEFANQEEYINYGTTAEEYIAQLGGLLESGKADLSKLATNKNAYNKRMSRLLNKIKQIINNIGKKLGISKPLFSVNQDPYSIIDFMIAMSDTLSEGGRVKQLMDEQILQGLVNSVQQGQAFGPLTEAPVAIENMPSSKASIIQAKESYDLSFVTPKDIIDIDAVIKDVIDNNKKVWFWIADQLGRGMYFDELINGEHFLDAGPSFALDPENRKKGVLWASGMQKSRLEALSREADYIFFISGSPERSKIFNKSVGGLVVKRIETVLSGLQGKDIELNDGKKNKVTVNINGDTAFDMFKNASLALLSKFESKPSAKMSFGALKNIIENANTFQDILDSTKRKDIFIFLNEQRDKQTAFANFTKLIGLDLDYNSLRDGFYKEHGFEFGEIMLVGKPNKEMPVGGTSNHSTYENNVMGEVVGVPNKRVHAADIVNKDIKDKLSKLKENEKKSTVGASLYAPYGAGISQGLDITSKAQIPAKHVGKVKENVMNLLNPYGVLGKEVFVLLKEKVPGNISAELYKAQKHHEELKRLLSNDPKILKQQLEGITNLMNGVQNGVKPSNKITNLVTIMRAHIDQLTERMIQAGVITDPEEVAMFRANMGSYMTRTYELFNQNSKFKKIRGRLTIDNVAGRLKNVDQAVVDRALDQLTTEHISEMRLKYPNDTDAEIMAKARRAAIQTANSILADKEAAAYFNKKIEGSIHAKALADRKDIAAPIRALMGEYKDPVYNYYSTVYKLSSLAASYEYMNDVKRIGLGKFLFENREDNTDASVQLASEKTTTLQPLAGLWTFPEIKEALELYDQQSSTLYTELIGKLRALKTVYNPGTHIKNVIGNLGFFWSNGHMLEAKEAFRLIKNYKSSKELQDIIYRLNKYGVLNNTINAGEIKNYFNKHESLQNMIDGIQGRNLYNKTKQAFERYYQIEDDIFKIIGYVNESNKYAKARFKMPYNQLSEAEKNKIDEEVDEIVKNTYPTFTRVPKGVKLASKYLLLGNFLSFPVETIRISYETYKLAWKEINSGNPVLFKSGMMRLAGTVVWNSAISGAVNYSASMASVGLSGMMGWMLGTKADDDEERKKRRAAAELFMAHYDRGKDVLYGQFENGKLVYYNIGSSDAFGYRHEIANAFWDNLDNDQGFYNSIAAAMYKSISPFLEPDMGINIIVNLLQGKDERGNFIFKSDDPSNVKALKGTMYAAKYVPFLGAAISKFGSTYMKKEGSAVMDAAMSLTPVKRTEVDLTKAFGFMLRGPERKGVLNDLKQQISPSLNFAERLKQTEATFNSMMYNPKPGDDLQKQALITNKQVLGILKELDMYYKAAVAGGANPEALVGAMKMAGIKEKYMAAIYYNELSAGEPMLIGY